MKANMMKFKTLLVEDNLDYRRVLKRALLKQFINMETKETAGESGTLNIVNTYYPDLIIMDINLHSDVSGLDLTKIIKVEHPEIVVAIHSQHDIPEYRFAAKQNRADYFLSKSSSLESMFEYVGSVVGRKNGMY